MQACDLTEKQMLEFGLTEKQMLEFGLQHVRQEAYTAICPPMNRADRRTARGRMLVAQAEAAALKAEVEFLREALFSGET